MINLRETKRELDKLSNHQIDISTVINKDYQSALEEQETLMASFLPILDSLQIEVSNFYELLSPDLNPTIKEGFETIISKIKELNMFETHYGTTNKLLFTLLASNNKKDNLIKDLRAHISKSQKKISE